MKNRNIIFIVLLAWAPWIVGWAGSISSGIDPNDGKIYFGGVQIGALSANGAQFDAIGSGVAPSATDGMFTGGNVDVTGTVECDIVESDNIYNEAGTAGPTLTLGAQTAPNYGISIGGTAPTTNALDILNYAGDVADPAANFSRIYFNSTGDQVKAVKPTANDIVLGDFSP